MYRLIASIKKEFLLLARDVAGMGILFVMPVFLVLVMTLIQDVSFRKLDETGLTLLFLDEDRDSLGISIRKGLEESKFFRVVDNIKGKPLTQEMIYDKVAAGDFQIGIIIRQGATKIIREQGTRMVRNTLFGTDSTRISGESNDSLHTGISLYFDPIIKSSFKQTVRTAIEDFTSKMEAKILFEAFTDEIAQYLPEGNRPEIKPERYVTFEEVYATSPYNEIIPNSAQHNVPGWTIFAMFFIVIPLTGNLIKERESGTGLRLRIMPVGYFHVLSAKILIYLSVCLIQFIMMMLVGIFVLPWFGLPSLHLGHHPDALILVALVTGLAATAYGVLVGTIATTHEQAAVFGSVSVIILAAVGGNWVPTFMMPQVMQKISVLSPLNWSQEAFYDIFLRGGGLMQIIDHAGLLFAFFLITLTAAVVYEKLRIK